MSSACQRCLLPEGLLLLYESDVEMHAPVLETTSAHTALQDPVSVRPAVVVKRSDITRQKELEDQLKEQQLVLQRYQLSPDYPLAAAVALANEVPTQLLHVVNVPSRSR